MDAFNEHFLDVIKNHYADFEGRARRREYWMFTAFNIGIIVLLQIVIAVLGSIADIFAMVGGLALVVFYLGILVPSLAVGIRRLHDTGRSGWFMLLALIPLVSLVLLYFMVIEGDTGPNEYGADPKDPMADDLSNVLDSY